MKIDKGVPIPERGDRKYPWKKMEVGDSFFVPGARVNASQPGDGRLFSTQHARRTVPGSVWLVRLTTEDGVAGARVWRTK